MSSVVIVGVDEEFRPFARHALQHLPPTRESLALVEHDAIEALGHGVDLLAIPDQPRVDEVRGDEIQLLLQFVRVRHVGQIQQHERDAVFAQQPEQLGPHPVAVANLDREAQLQR